MSTKEQGRGIVSGIRELFEIVRIGLSENKISANELSAEDYLLRLSAEDRKEVERFVGFIKGLEGTKGFENAKLGVIAIGSLTRPQEKLHHPVRDIDLKILHAAKNSRQRESVVRNLCKEITEYIIIERKLFDFNDQNSTASFSRDGTKWVCNSNPSFRVKPQEGCLPLHISISGPRTHDLHADLKEERRCNTYFALLL